MNGIVSDTQMQEKILPNPQEKQAEPRPVKVLIRVYPDGYCEVYSDQRLHLHVQKVMDAPGIDGERLAIEFADSTMPLSHCGLDDARKLIQTFDCRPCTVQQFVTRQASLSALRIMDAYIARVAQ